MTLINKNFKLKNLELSSRLVMPPMATSKSNELGEVNKELCNYYNEKSSGNYIGLIILEHSYISLKGKARIGQISISKDSDIEGLKKIVSTIHKNGIKVIAQLNHAGSRTKYSVTGLESLSVSILKKQHPLISKSYNSKEINDEDIKKIIKIFTNAAIRAKKAGFDGVKIHSVHGYLLNQFYSPLTNKRTDKYTGNTLLGRIQLHLEIIKEIRKAVGEDYLIALRLGDCDYSEGGQLLKIAY